jgi:hypothetical protein
LVIGKRLHKTEFDHHQKRRVDAWTLRLAMLSAWSETARHVCKGYFSQHSVKQRFLRLFFVLLFRFVHAFSDRVGGATCVAILKNVSDIVFINNATKRDAEFGWLT